MSERPRMDQAPEVADMLALLRAHLAGDDATIQALLIETRLDPYAMLSVLTGRLVDYGTRLYGSADDLDRALTDEQQQLRR